MPLTFDCCICGNPLEEPGALAFSPPDWPFGMVDKFHICKPCWFTKIRKAILNG